MDHADSGYQCRGMLRHPDTVSSTQDIQKSGEQYYNSTFDSQSRPFTKENSHDDYRQMTATSLTSVLKIDKDASEAHGLPKKEHAYGHVQNTVFAKQNSLPQDHTTSAVVCPNKSARKVTNMPCNADSEDVSCNRKSVVAEASLRSWALPGRQHYSKLLDGLPKRNDSAMVRKGHIGTQPSRQCAPLLQSKIPCPPRAEPFSQASLEPIDPQAFSRIPGVTQHRAKYNQPLRSSFEIEFQDLANDPEVIAMIHAQHACARARSSEHGQVDNPSSCSSKFTCKKPCYSRGCAEKTVLLCQSSQGSSNHSVNARLCTQVNQARINNGDMLYCIPFTRRLFMLSHLDVLAEG